jgi:hypothetical protein
MGRGKVSETASGVVIRSRQLMSTVLYPSGSDAKWNVLSTLLEAGRVVRREAETARGMRGKRSWLQTPLITAHMDACSTGNV